MNRFKNWKDCLFFSMKIFIFLNMISRINDLSRSAITVKVSFRLFSDTVEEELVWESDLLPLNSNYADGSLGLALERLSLSFCGEDRKETKF